MYDLGRPEEPVVSVRGLVKRYGGAGAALCRLHRLGRAVGLLRDVAQALRAARQRHAAVAVGAAGAPDVGVRRRQPRQGDEDPGRLPAAHRWTGFCPGARPGHGGRRLAGPGGGGLAGVGARARPVRPGVPGHVRRVLPRATGYRRDHRPGRSHREGGRARHQALRRPTAPARFRPRPHRRPRAHLPGRADHWFRPVRPPRRLGGRCRAPATRQDRLPHHPLHGRGGIPGRPDRRALRRAHRG